MKRGFDGESLITKLETKRICKTLIFRGGKKSGFYDLLSVTPLQLW